MDRGTYAEVQGCFEEFYFRQSLVSTLDGKHPKYVYGNM